jgi:hypothetical protein
MAGCQRQELLSSACEEAIGVNDEPAGSELVERSEIRRLLIIGANAVVQEASQRPKYLILAFNAA